MRSLDPQGYPHNLLTCGNKESRHMTGPWAAVDSSSGRSRNGHGSCFAPAPGSDKHTRVTPARSSRAPAPGDIQTVVVLTSARLADKSRHHPPFHHGDPARHPDPASSTPQGHDQQVPRSSLARPEKHLAIGPASSFGTVQAQDDGVEGEQDRWPAVRRRGRARSSASRCLYDVVQGQGRQRHDRPISRSP